MKAIISYWSGRGHPDPKALALDHCAQSLASIGWEIERLPRQTLANHETALRNSDWLIQFQPFYSFEAEHHKAVQFSGIRTLYLEFGLAVGNHYGTVLSDDLGSNATASVMGRFDLIANQPIWAEAIENTLKIAEKCNLHLVFVKPILPEFN